MCQCRSSFGLKKGTLLLEYVGKRWYGPVSFLLWAEKWNDVVDVPTVIPSEGVARVEESEKDS